MQYYLFHPVICSSYDDSSALLKRFMGIGKSYSHAMELGTEKIRQLEDHETDGPLVGLVNGFSVKVIAKEHARVIEKVIDRFGFGLHAKDATEKAPLSMISLLLKSGRYDVIDQIIGTQAVPAIKFSV